MHSKLLFLTRKNKLRIAKCSFFDTSKRIQRSNTGNTLKRFYSLPGGSNCTFPVPKTLPQPGRAVPGPQLSTGIGMLLVQIRSGGQQQQQLLHGDHVLSWRRHLAPRAVLKHFKYLFEVVCVLQAALSPLVREPPCWLGEAGQASSVLLQGCCQQCSCSQRVSSMHLRPCSLSGGVWAGLALFP